MKIIITILLLTLSGTSVCYGEEGSAPLNHKHRRTASQHAHTLNMIKNNSEQLEVFRKKADSYFHSYEYKKAKEYYKSILELEPANVTAQRMLDNIERLLKPQVFAQVDLFNIKGDSNMLVQTYGGSLELDDEYRMETEYVMNRRVENGVDRYFRQSLDMEISRGFDGGLLLIGGVILKYYSMKEPGVFDYYAKALRSFGNNVSVNITYDKKREDAKHKILAQNVDRHRLTLGGHWNIGEYYSLSGSVEGSYYTRGHAPNNNANISASISPSFHIVRDKPTVDLSYTYHRLDTLRKDVTRNGDEMEYEYYSPRLLEVHSATLYATHSILDDKLSVSFSETISYRPSDETMHNMLYAEVKWNISDNDVISGVFVRTRNIMNVPDSYQKTQQFTVKYSRIF